MLTILYIVLALVAVWACFKVFTSNEPPVLDDVYEPPEVKPEVTADPAPVPTVSAVVMTPEAPKAAAEPKKPAAPKAPRAPRKKKEDPPAQ